MVTANQAVQTVEGYIAGLIKKNPNGEITLNEIEQATKFSRGELVKQLKAMKIAGAVYKIGRRGHASRVLWGENAKQAIVPIASPRAPRAQRQENGEHNAKLRIEIGGQSIFLPVKTELIAA